MAYLLVPYVVLLVIYVAIASKHGGLLNPDGFFVLFNSLALLGTMILIDQGRQVDRRYGWLVFLCCILYVFVSVLIRISWPSLHESNRPDTYGPASLRVMLPLYALSLVVSSAYYIAVGHVTLLDSFRAMVNGGTYDAQTARLDSYAGSRYLFPGYVNQFKNALLPVLTLALIHRAWIRGVAGRLPLSVALGLIMFVCVAGTGQRGALVITMIVYTITLAAARLLTGSRLAIAAVGAFVAFAVLTVLLGRNQSQLTVATGIGGKLGVMVEAFWSRVVLENPYSGLAAFQYTERLAPPGFGREWLTDIAGILPGFRGSDLANQVFKQLYGTPRGTAPTSLWGGAFYNFGLVGTAVLVVVIAIVINRVTYRFFVRPPAREMDFLELACLSGMTVSLGAWIAGSPLTVLNQGFFAYLALFLFSQSRRNQIEPGAAAENEGRVAPYMTEIPTIGAR